jgi:hypothetical protein
MATDEKHDETQRFALSSAFSHVFSSAVKRGSKALGQSKYLAAAAHLLGRVPGTSANYTLLDTDNPSYDIFEPSQSNDTAVRADVQNFMSTSIQYDIWAARGRAIRGSGSRALCIGNLSIALDQLGAAYAAGSQGAGTLLTLIPTASVLIGAPAKELWVL